MGVAPVCITSVSVERVESIVSVRLPGVDVVAFACANRGEDAVPCCQFRACATNHFHGQERVCGADHRSAHGHVRLFRDTRIENPTTQLGGMLQISMGAVRPM